MEGKVILEEHFSTELNNKVLGCKGRRNQKRARLCSRHETGRPWFKVMHGSRRLPSGWRLGFYVFDLLQVGSRSLIRERLSNRFVREQGLEGVMAKRLEINAPLMLGLD